MSSVLSFEVHVEAKHGVVLTPGAIAVLEEHEHQMPLIGGAKRTIVEAGGFMTVFGHRVEAPTAVPTE